MFKKIIALAGIFLVIFLLFRVLSGKNGLIKSAATAKPQKKTTWFYPLTKYATRGYLKKFGAFIDEKFYAGREELFPTQYFGYHSGVDLEITPAESSSSTEVPVYAVASGKIVFIGEVSGYGGVILEKLDGTNHTALYGHVKTNDLSIKDGDRVKAGQKLTVLGDAYSVETGGERKHLHFGIYRGTDLYFFGHEATYEDLNLNWVDPTKFLQEKKAVEPK